MMRNRFDQQLEQLHADLITMGACARLRSLQQWMRPPRATGTWQRPP